MRLKITAQELLPERKAFLGVGPHGWGDDGVIRQTSGNTSVKLSNSISSSRCCREGWDSLMLWHWHLSVDDYFLLHNTRYPGLSAEPQRFLPRASPGSAPLRPAQTHSRMLSVSQIAAGLHVPQAFTTTSAVLTAGAPAPLHSSSSSARPHPGPDPGPDPDPDPGPAPAATGPPAPPGPRLRGRFGSTWWRPAELPPPPPASLPAGPGWGRGSRCWGRLPAEKRHRPKESEPPRSAPSAAACPGVGCAVRHIPTVWEDALAVLGVRTTAQAENLLSADSWYCLTILGKPGTRA